MPQRPRSHVLEAESRTALRNVLPAAWIIRDETPDYGIDLSIEIVSEEGNVSGKRFVVQLKATDQSSLKRALEARLSIANFRYLQKLDVPALVVVFHAPTQTLYSRWIHELDVFYAGKSKTHFTFRLSPSDEFDTTKGAARLERDFDDWRWLHTPVLTSPLVLRLNISTPLIRGLPPLEVMERLQELAKPLRGRLAILEIPVGRPRGEIDVSADDVTVRLYGGGGAALHRSLAEAQRRERGLSKPPSRSAGQKGEKRRRGPRPPNTSEQVAADIIVAVAMALQHAGHPRDAADVLELVFARAAISHNPSAFATMVHMLISAGRHEVVVSAAEALAIAGSPEFAQWAIRAVLVVPPPTDRQDEVGAALERWLASQPETYPSHERGTDHYNVGRYVGMHGVDVRGGISHLIKAARLYPSYRKRGYFWEELGAMLFWTNHFEWAARAYGIAADLGRDTVVFAKQADALWRAGRYGDAKEAMAKYTGSDAHWIALNSVLPAVIEAAGAPRQTRQPALAADIIKDGAAMMGDVAVHRERWTAAIRADALSSSAWYNLGLADAAIGDYHSAVIAFVVAGLIQPADTDAWANALASCVMWVRSQGEDASHAESYFALIALVGAHQDREGLYRAMVSRLSLDSMEARQTVQGMFSALPEKDQPTPVIRITMEGTTHELPADDPEALFRILTARSTPSDPTHGAS